MTKLFDGTGVGLAICKKIVETHNGTIDVKILVEVGANYTVQVLVAQVKNSDRRVSTQLICLQRVRTFCLRVIINSYCKRNQLDGNQLPYIL